MPEDALKKRFLWVYICLSIIATSITVQLFNLQILRRAELMRHAARQHELLIDLPAKRGNLYDRNLKELATTLKVPSIYAVPRMIPKEKVREYSKKLSKILNVSEEKIYKRLSSDKAFAWMKRRVKTSTLDKIQELKDPAFGYLFENKRFYPHGSLGSQVLGFVNIDGKGIEGIELVFDKYLRGESGFRVTTRDALGRDISALDQKTTASIDGANLILTIDHYIQYLTERALGEAFEKWKAIGGMAIVMDPMTGEILAMASRPTYNPLEIGKYPAEARRNRTITDFYEPGSVFKAITASASLNEGIMKRTDTVFCENGSWKVGRNTLHDVHGYGTLDFDTVFIKSSNIGTVKIARKLGEEKLYEYIERFGFGKLTGIEFPGEVRGISRPPSKWSKNSINAIPIGQEIAATPLQVLRAYSVIANGGKMVKPFIVSEIKDTHNVTLKKFSPQISENIIKEDTSRQVTEILEHVVTEGTGKRARIDGIRVAGKTGTSQKVDPKGGYSHSHFMATFVGFAPVENPRLAMIVVLDDPRPLYYGGTVAGPVFKDVIEKSLLYLGVVPEIEEKKGKK